MSPSPADTAASIEAFIRREAAVADDDPCFGRQVNLFDAGYLDSLTVVALTVHIEEALGTPISDIDLFDPRFATIDGMAELVAERAGRTSDAAPGITADS
ncbi:acyl carrier protein [Streptomyces sp. SAI-090]|nr:acyl carrier protein [Streptomyces sp. SAI-090]MDH6522332.1 acyl carrier protein [Streptomyces sp. SAI-090]